MRYLQDAGVKNHDLLEFVDLGSLMNTCLKNRKGKFDEVINVFRHIKLKGYKQYCMNCWGAYGMA